MKETTISMTTKKKILIGVIIAIVAVAIIRVIVSAGLIGLVLFGYLTSKPEVYDEIENYMEYMSFGTKNADSKWNKWSMDESIWPHTLDDTSDVIEYKMVYYNPWDAQYLGYLVMEYSDTDYDVEVKRLRNYPSTDYIGYYSVTEEKTYELLAIYADEYNGFVYALTDGHNRIIYAEEIFCNYYMDLNYTEYMPKEYFLDGFDATKDNPYRKKMMNE